MAHIIDLSSALFNRKVNKEHFDKVESNVRLGRMLDRFGVKKGVLFYELTEGLEMMAIMFLATLITFKINYDLWNISNSSTFFFLFCGIIHSFGFLTNVVSSIQGKKIKKRKKLNELINKEGEEI